MEMGFLDSLFLHSTLALSPRHLYIALKQLITWLNHVYKRSILIVNHLFSHNTTPMFQADHESKSINDIVVVVVVVVVIV